MDEQIANDIARLAQIFGDGSPGRGVEHGEEAIGIGLRLLGGFLSDIRAISKAQEQLASTVSHD
jgi:hypothetical protein